MIKYLWFWLAAGSLLLLAGAGCANNQAIDDSDDDYGTNNSGVISTDTVSRAPTSATSSNNTTSSQNALSDSRVFNLSGRNFVFSLTEIKVKKGDKVTIDFSSADGYHDWVVDEFKAATARVQTGASSSVTFVADKTGTYEYYCSVGSHRQMGMVGKLIVE